MFSLQICTYPGSSPHNSTTSAQLDVTYGSSPQDSTHLHSYTETLGHHQDSTTSAQDEEPQVAENLKTCPECTRKITVRNFSRHLRKVHSDVGSAERAALLQTLRKRKCQTKNGMQHPGRRCPFKSCMGTQQYRKRGQHFKQVHKLCPSDDLYQKNIRIKGNSTADFKEEHHWPRVKEEYKEFLERCS